MSRISELNELHNRFNGPVPEYLKKAWRDRWAKRHDCDVCNGTGAVETPFSGSDPSCEHCNGEGWVEA